MIDNTFYGEDAQLGTVGNKHESPAIPVIAMSVLDGRECWFPSLMHASDSLNISENGISLCLRGENYTKAEVITFDTQIKRLSPINPKILKHWPNGVTK